MALNLYDAFNTAYAISDTQVPHWLAQTCHGHMLKMP